MQKAAEVFFRRQCTALNCFFYRLKVVPFKRFIDQFFRDRIDCIGSFGNRDEFQRLDPVLRYFKYSVISPRRQLAQLRRRFVMELYVDSGYFIIDRDLISH